jgi:hypothetical protein
VLQTCGSSILWVPDIWLNVFCTFIKPNIERVVVIFLPFLHVIGQTQNQPLTLKRAKMRARKTKIGRETDNPKKRAVRAGSVPMLYNSFI